MFLQAFFVSLLFALFRLFWDMETLSFCPFDQTIAPCAKIYIREHTSYMHGAASSAWQQAWRISHRRVWKLSLDCPVTKGGRYKWLKLKIWDNESVPCDICLLGLLTTQPVVFLRFKEALICTGRPDCSHHTFKQGKKKRLFICCHAYLLLVLV